MAAMEDGDPGGGAPAAEGSGGDGGRPRQKRPGPAASGSGKRQRSAQAATAATLTPAGSTSLGRGQIGIGRFLVDSRSSPQPPLPQPNVANGGRRSGRWSGFCRSKPGCIRRPQAPARRPADGSDSGRLDFNNQKTDRLQIIPGSATGGRAGRSRMREAAAEAEATPQSSSTITDGAVSGTLPVAEAFAVHYPGYPSSPARASHTLGGLPAIAKVRSFNPASASAAAPAPRLELRFRPEDPDCHPAFGEHRASTGLLLRLSRPKGGCGPPRAEVVARVGSAYHFEGMADFQHVVPVHAAEGRKRKRLDRSKVKDDLGIDKAGDLETEDGDVMMLVPRLFSIKDTPTNIALLPSSNLLSKSKQRGVVQHRWEMDIEPTLALPFNIQSVPKKINWEDHIPKNSSEWDWQMAVYKLFDERPVWPRQSLYERLLDDGVQVSIGQFKSILFRAGYYFSTGPFGKFWIRKEYDPRKDPESRIYQRIDFRMPLELRNLQKKKHCGSEKWSDMCKLERMPSKSFIFLQLFELKDDFIQAEIRKPSHQSTCSNSTGWFSKPMIETLRLQLSIRFISLCPNEDAKNILRTNHERIERTKKQEAICRSEKMKERKDVDEEAPGKHAGSEDQVDTNNSDSEDVDEEEDKEESDGYDSPSMAEDVPDFTLHDSYTLGEGLSTGYLEEVLRSFPLNEDGQDKIGDALNNAEASDGEFEIFEQPSDDEEYSDG